MALIYITSIKMVTHVPMLRGINVGSQKRVKMEELIILYESLDFQNVTSYAQSGNLIFNVSEKIKDLPNIIEKEIKQVFSLPVAVLVRTSIEPATNN